MLKRIALCRVRMKCFSDAEQAVRINRVHAKGIVFSRSPAASITVRPLDFSQDRIQASAMNQVNLKANPFAIFEKNASPVSIHARWRWITRNNREAGEAARKLCANQAKDGSWKGSVGKTVQNLFWLLLLSEPDSSTERAINWLLETHCPPMEHPEYNNLFFVAKRVDTQKDLFPPFTKGCTGFVKTGAALYMAGLLGQGDEERIEKAFQALDQLPAKRNGRWCSTVCSNNILQGYSTHPLRCASPAMRIAVKTLEQDQTDNGDWGERIPFYPTFFALSRIPLKSAETQFFKALPRVLKNQKSDGSWRNNELVSYMVLDALERKGLLPSR